MDFTHVRVHLMDDGKKIYAFFNQLVLCATYHEDDLAVEWAQLAFILEKAQTYDYALNLTWYGGRQILVDGIDKDKVSDLDCKLISFQTTHRIPFERSLELGMFVPQTSEVIT